MRRLLAFGLLVLSVGCSADDDPKRTRESFCQEWAEQACSGNVVSACQASSAESCRLAQTGFCLSLVPSAFSPAAADECLAAVGAAYADADLTGPELDTVLHLGPPCNRVVEGHSGVGETCTNDRDCKGSSGYECVIKGGRTEGTCQIPQVVGAGLRCAAAQQVCMAGFYCNGSNCIEAKSVSEVCTNDEECGDSGFCGAEGACEARLPVDSACTASNQCLSELCFSFSNDDRTCVDRIRLSRSEPICEDLR